MQRGETYKVNEQGPEMLSVGNEDFLLMGGSGGRVTPNNRLKGGGGGGSQGNVYVNVFNAEGHTASVEENAREDGGMNIDVFIQRVENALASGITRGDGALGQTIEDQYGLNRGVGASG